jgi:hypothetical protein
MDSTTTRRRKVRHGLHGWVALSILALAMGRPTGAATAPEAGEKKKIEIELRLMFWAVAGGADDLPSGSPAPTPQTEDIQDLFLRRGRVILVAQASPKVDLYAQLGQDNVGSKVLRDDAGFRVKDLYLNYKRADALQFMVGQFKVPFLRQNLQSAFNQLLVDRALLPSLRPAIEGSRDQGGMIWGNHGGLQYRVAVFDGSDQEDSNPTSSLRGAARVSWNWFTPETGAGYTGTTIGEKRILQVAVQADAQSHRLDSKDDSAFTAESRAYRAWAADLFYDQPFAGTWALTFEGAWLERRDDYDGPGADTRSIRGYYTQAGLLLPGHVGPGRLQVVGRYENLDTDRGAVTATVHNRTAGLTYFAAGHGRKIQLDYTERHERPTALDNDEIRLSVVTTF